MSGHAGVTRRRSHEAGYQESTYENGVGRVEYVEVVGAQVVDFAIAHGHGRHHRPLMLSEIRATDREPVKAPMVPASSMRWLNKA